MVCIQSAPVSVEGLFVLLLSAFTVAQAPYPVITPPRNGDNGCCYGRLSFENGQTVTTLPECCVSLVCVNGEIKPRHFGTPGSSGCCEFDGQMYPPGAQLSSYCVPLVCREGNWTYSRKIEECCKMCKVYNDPHFSTFDGYRYHWHGDCNYTITQTGRSHYPEVGVFSDFQPCFGSPNGASCLFRSTFKNDKHTVITLDHNSLSIFSIFVNGHPFTVPTPGVHPVESEVTHPVLAWRDGSCIFLAGSSRILVRHCRHHLKVWAYPAHTNQLDGLCGHFNFYQNDDMTNRDGTVHPLNPWPQAFPESWKTNDQTDRKCLAPCLYCKETTTNPCRAPASEMELLRSRCAARIHFILGRDLSLIHHVDSCAWDLCMARQAGLSLTEQEQWINEIVKIVTDSRLMEVITSGTLKPQSTPSTGVCTPGSRWKRNCNWCTCRHDSTADCFTNVCQADYQHPAGTDACVDDSWWRLDDCNWCTCIKGGHICTFNNCTSEGTEPTKPTISTLPTDEVCFYTHDPGSCGSNSRNQVRYYYNYFYGRCTTFLYTGCGGNDNNFPSEAECMRACGHLTTPTPPSTTPSTTTVTRPPHCSLQPEGGPCEAVIRRYYYNATTNTCEPFTYGGCLPNGNNFKSRALCEEECQAASQAPTYSSTHLPPVIPYRCFLTPQRGPCGGQYTKYYYSRNDGACLPFTFSGCGGNDNNFDTKQNCEDICLVGSSVYTTASATVGYTTATTRKNICSMDPDPGSCNEHVTRYYFDQSTNSCRKFMYGGCAGNMNNFISEDWCLAACYEAALTTATVPTGLPTKCYQDPEVGDCYENLWRWFYNSTQHSCQVFVYGGCHGNSNNFLTKEECEAACGGQTQSTTVSSDGNSHCYLPKAYGTCSNPERRYYYNYKTRDCEEFTFSGCGGNRNNYKTLAECWQACQY